ncbi:protein JASON-like [Solanum dulcamara]|uniref:protein JASON-like n=1 Tax=Solanum dulcamara TaxID=45834 RepID=UPI0024859E33|nr:protein JASON-like [Solanum dulcamara]
MLWSRLPSEESDHTNNRDIFGVFRVLVVAAMGCLFGCFRINDGSLSPDSKSHLVSQSIPPKEPVVSRNRSPLSSLFSSEEKGEDDDLHKTEKANQDAGTPKSELHTKELRDQAKFLKACGTLPETPAEIRKGLAKFEDLSASTRSVEPLKFKSWLSDMAVEKLNLDLLPDHPITPIKSNGLEKQSGSLAHTFSSCMTDGQNGQSLPKNSIHGSGSSNTPTSIEFNANQAHRDAASVVSPIFAPSAQYMNKIVRFDCESDLSAVSPKSTASALDSENSKQAEFSGNYYASKNSPYPTPLKLSDEMQTPGTVYPTYLDNIANGKAARIRSQYVYPVLNPVDRASQLKELSDEDSYSIENSNSLLWSSNMTESGERPNEASFSSELGMSELRKASADKDLKVEASLSSWLKPSTVNQDEGKQHTSAVYGNNVHYGRTPGDRPILGLVAAHWKDDEDSRISPKWWDGNGIPNSTNKYKEDQKVSWHATPFEERLEKALSQESSIPQSKQLSGTTPFAFNDMEETDTAISQLH